MPAVKKKAKTKKTTTKTGAKKTTKKVTAKSPAKKTTKTSLKKIVEKKTAPKKSVKKAASTEKKTKKDLELVKNNKKALENTIELPKTKEQVRIEEETRQLNLKKELENKLALEENLEKTHELSLTKIIKLKKKSHAKNIARNKTNEFIKKIKKLQRKIKIYGIDSVIPRKYLTTGIVAVLIVLICIMSINLIKPEIQSINLENISKEIDQLKTLKFEISNTNKIIDESKAYKSTLKEYYEYDFSDFGLQRSWLDEFKIYYHEKNKQLFMVFKP